MERHGKILRIPYEFRPPTLSRIKERIWNPNDPRIFTPHIFGVGWAINLPAAKKRSKPAYYAAVAIYTMVLISMVGRIYGHLRRLRGLLS